MKKIMLDVNSFFMAVCRIIIYRFFIVGYFSTTIILPFCLIFFYRQLHKFLSKKTQHSTVARITIFMKKAIYVLLNCIYTLCHLSSTVKVTFRLC